MKTRVINGRTWSLDPVPALQSFALQPLVAPVVGRALGVVLHHFGSDEGLSLATLDLAALMTMAPEMVGELGEALGVIKPGDLVTLTRGLLGAALVDGAPLFPQEGSDKRFNEVFAGRTRDLWLLLWFAIQVNYPDFLPARAASAGAGAGNPSASSSTSPGAGPSIGSSTPTS